MPRKSKHEIPEEKLEIMKRIIEGYHVETAADLQEALKDLLGGTIQTMLNQELESQMQEREESDPSYSDSRNGYKPKTLRSSVGEIPISVPQDRNSDFEPRVVPKYERDISEIEGKIIAMYARGMSTRQISDQVRDIYGFDVSEGMVTAITNQLLPEIEAWQKRPLSTVYPIVYIDAIVFNVRENNVIRKQAAYVILGINEEGHKEVVSITIGETESAKYWLSVLNELKNRGLQDIFVLCADGLSGIREAIAAAYPKTEYQRCIVHVVRNTLKYVADKDKKAFANALKTIYHAPDEKQGFMQMERVAETWNAKYPGCMNRWADNWDCISPMFKFSQAVRKVIYTTNAIESLNSGYRRLNRARSIFPSATALLKALYLTTFELTKKWSLPVRNWGAVYAELSVMYPGRFTDDRPLTGAT
jgi:putative transposase